MKVIRLLAIVLILLTNQLGAQELPTVDTTIFKVASEMPRFPGCEQLDTTMAAKMECSQASLLNFMYSNIQYPLEARQEGIEGTVVISFVVEKDGFISNPNVMKDIGGGCGQEALRVALAMNSAMADAGLRWIPAKKDGQSIRMQYNLPIRFKLKDPPDFVMVGIDTVYVEMDDSLNYKGGNEALSTFLKSKLKYPSSLKDSCFVGAMDVKVLVFPDGMVKVLDVSDYFDLGFDFQFEAIQAATATFGNWDPATLRGRKVPTTYDFMVEFLPEESRCQQSIMDYEKAQVFADEGLALFNEGNEEGGIEKLTEAITLFPENANYRYIRGQAYMSLEKMEEACEDFTMVKKVLSISLVNNLLPIICNQ